MIARCSFVLVEFIVFCCIRTLLYNCLTLYNHHNDKIIRKIMCTLNEMQRNLAKLSLETISRIQLSQINIFHRKARTARASNIKELVRKEREKYDHHQDHASSEDDGGQHGGDKDHHQQDGASYGDDDAWLGDHQQDHASAGDDGAQHGGDKDHRGWRLG